MSESSGEVILWGIREESTLIGFIGIIGIPDYPSLFYAMHPNYRGKGIMTECITEITQWFVEIYPTLQLHTEVYKNNIQSQKILSRQGFKLIDSDADKFFYQLEVSN